MSKPKSNAREIHPDNVYQMVNTGVFGTHYSNDVLVHAARWNEPEKAKKIVKGLMGNWRIEKGENCFFVEKDDDEDAQSYFIAPDRDVFVVVNGTPFTMPEKVFDILFAPIQQ